MTVNGAEQSDAVAAALKAAASDLRREMQAALREAVPTLTANARSSARERLPRHGGLNDRVADDRYVAEDRSSIVQAGIRFGTASSDARSTNRGRIRHPVFGHRDTWVEQSYPPARGWFDDAMAAARPQVDALVEAAMKKIAERATHQ